MNNRFKFRGVLTVAYSGENADDKTVDLIIEKADAIYSGDIGFDIDQLDAAIKKAGITDDIEIDQIHEFCYDNNGCRSDEYFVMDGDIKQCTGLKDKNGNLIYEGDVVDYFGEPATIVWDCCGFKIKTNDDICHEFYRNGIEIIDNVHKTGIEIIGNVHTRSEE